MWLNFFEIVGIPMACQEAPVSASHLLSMEMWAKVFSYIFEEPTDLLAFPCSDPYCFLVHQANFQKLRLVCKAFNTTFDEESFTRHLAIPMLQSDQSLPSLLKYVRHHQRSLVAITSGFGRAPIDSAWLHCLLALPHNSLSLRLQICLAALCIGCLHLPP